MGATAALAALAVLALLAAVACAAPPRPEGTAVIASGTDLEGANALVTVHNLSRQVQRHVLFVTLARYDSALAAVPYAARRWRWSADGRTLTLVLTRALRWHDGVPTTARDAAFTLEAARDPATGYPRAADLATIAGAAAPDDSTLVVRFTSAPAAFPAVLCELPILPAHLLAGVPRRAMRQAPFNLAPVGNGPFRFVERVPGQRWTFARNDAFPAELGGPPRLRRLVVAVVDEATTKFAGLVSGELDAAGIAPTSAAMVASDPSLRVLDYPLLLANALVFNPARAPFDDARVRRALSLAVDRRQLVRAALAGFASPAAGPVSPDNPLAVHATPEEDTARADALLDDAGWLRGAAGVRARGGRELAVELLTVGSGDNAVEQLVQAQLARRGIRVAIRQLEMGAFLARARATPRDFDMLFTGIPGDLSLAYLAGMYDSRLAGGTLDYAGFHGARLDALLARAREAPDTASLRVAWAAVQEELGHEMPAAWLYHSRGVQGLARRLTGVRMDLRGELATVHDWSIEAPR